ncbi:MAG: arginase [Bacteroidia bacterium]
MAKLEIIENPSELGAGTRGASLGIGALKVAAFNAKSDFFKKYASTKITDYNYILHSDIKTPKAKRIDGIVKVYNEVAEAVSKSIQHNKFPLVLAGDHSSAGGTITGVKLSNPDARVGVVWIDAHADLHTPYTTPSGNIHGMPLATALGIDNKENKQNQPTEEGIKFWKKLKTVGKITPKIQPKDLVYVALRDFESPEENFIRENKITVHSVRDVRKLGAEEIAKKIQKQLTKCDVIYISFDVDSLDCDLVSYGTGTPAEDGLTEQEASQLINLLLLDKKVCCLEVVEINPCLDNKQNRMAETAFRIIEKAAAIITKR